MTYITLADTSFRGLLMLFGGQEGELDGKPEIQGIIARHTKEEMMEYWEAIESMLKGEDESLQVQAMASLRLLNPIIMEFSDDPEELEVYAYMPYTQRIRSPLFDIFSTFMKPEILEKYPNWHYIDLLKEKNGWDDAKMASFAGLTPEEYQEQLKAMIAKTLEERAKVPEDVKEIVQKIEQTEDTIIEMQGIKKTPKEVEVSQQNAELDFPIEDSI